MSYMESYGFVYVLTDGEAFKVGETSGCPKKRLQSLQSGNPTKLRMVRLYEAPDRKAVEKHFHEYLQPWRCSGGVEWFDCSETELDEAAEDLEFLFGAVDIGPTELRKAPKQEFSKKVLDWWVNGDTLTLCLETPAPDDDLSGCLNFTLDSSNGESRTLGHNLIAHLGRLLGIRKPTADSVRRWLRANIPYRYDADELYVTYRRKKSRWIDLNDFELISVSWKPAKYLEAAS